MTHALARRDLPSLPVLQSYAEVLSRSGFFHDARDAAKAAAKILAGAELGFSPMASMSGINVIQGRVAISATLMAAAIKRSGTYDYRVTRLTDAECSIEFYSLSPWTSGDNGKPVQERELAGESTFTMKDALKAGLGMRQTWRNYPRNMLFARALSNGARWHCPGVFGGPVYVPEELGATVDEMGAAVSLPTHEAVEPFDAVSVVMRRLNELHGDAWHHKKLITKAIFGETLLTDDDLESFAQVEPDRWTEGAEKLLELTVPA